MLKSMQWNLYYNRLAIWSLIGSWSLSLVGSGKINPQCMRVGLQYGVVIGVVIIVAASWLGPRTVVTLT